MIYDPFMTPDEHRMQIAARARAKRLSFNLSQKSLSLRSGVSFGVIKKFERTGKISLESLLNLAMSLDCLGDFWSLFKEKQLESSTTLDELLKDDKRKRGRT